MPIEIQTANKMHNYVALFRGINVGGHNSLPMADLKSELDAMGVKDAATYIQSGNVVFQSKKLLSKKFEEELSNRIEKQKGFKPDVITITEKAFKQAISNCPFETTEGKTLHYFFAHSEIDNVNHDLIEQLKTSTEQTSVCGNVFYLFAPDGIGRSKLAAKVEKIINKSGTARNWNTVEQLQKMLADIDKC